MIPIVTTPNSLLSRVLKARYFPHTDFFGAELGNLPSFTWRSIISAKPILIAGSRWRVGSGSSINVWEDRWIPRPSSFKPLIRQPRDPTITRVDQLLLPYNAGWNIELIEETFCPSDAKLIRSIPLGRSSREDRLIWHFEKNGVFSVRSAHRVALALEGATRASSSSAADNPIWGKIWKLHVAPKVRVFVWRVLHDILPTSSNLVSRRCLVDLLCPVCGDAPENTKHIFLECSFARQVWAISLLPWTTISKLTRGVHEWIETVFSSFDVGDRDRFSLILWGLWWFRNKVRTEGCKWRPDELMNFALSLHNSSLTEFNPPPPVNDSSSSSCWRPPPGGVVKINVDGAVFANVGEVGIGVVARDQDGSCLGWMCDRFKGELEPEAVEAVAIIRAMDLARDNGWQTVWIESDCLNLVNKIVSSDEDLSPIGNLVHDIKSAAASFPCCRFFFVRREANVVAHTLARNAAPECMGGSICPSFLVDFLLADCSF